MCPAILSARIVVFFSVVKQHRRASENFVGIRVWCTSHLREEVRELGHMEDTMEADRRGVGEGITDLRDHQGCTCGGNGESHR